MLWFSPDEIKLSDANNEKQLPNTFPFDTLNNEPLVYYKVRYVYGSNTNSAVMNPQNANKDLLLLNLNHVRAIDLDYYYYFADETGPPA